MRCPSCNKDNDRVIDTRTSQNGYSIRRRRRCLSCGRRFTTYERVVYLVLHVVKKSGAREPFRLKKLRRGIRIACEKRPISPEQIEQIVTEIANELYQNYESEVPSRAIGDLVMEKLRDLDQVAYVRFASVYREFKDIRDFVSEVEPMLRSDD